MGSRQPETDADRGNRECATFATLREWWLPVLPKMNGTPQHNTRIDWLTTPPLKNVPRLKRKLDSSSSPIHPWSLRLKQPTKSVPGKKEFRNVLDRLDNVLKKTQNAKAVGEIQTEAIRYEAGRGYRRFVVSEQFIDTESEQEATNIIRLLCPYSEEEVDLKLSGDWINTVIRPGTIVNVISNQINSKNIVIDNTDGLLVVNPDVLISSTSLSDSFQCLRRSVLKERIKYSGQSTDAMFSGTILHQLFQASLASKNWSLEFLSSILRNLINESMEDLYALGKNGDEAYAEMSKNIKFVMDFSEKYMVPDRKDADFRILNVVDLEERIWSPKYGLKGNIDVSAKVDLKKAGKQCILPLELKTGFREHISHRAQTSLYSLMMSDRYATPVEEALLVYLQRGESFIINTNPAEIRALVIGRNSLAEFVSDGFGMPPMLETRSVCDRCYMAKECVIYEEVSCE
jgi:DNA replication ATP-dependent helicase Dna2